MLFDWSRVLQTVLSLVVGYAGWWARQATLEMRRLQGEMGRFRETIARLDTWTSQHEIRDTERHSELRGEIIAVRDRVDRVMRPTRGNGL